MRIGLWIALGILVTLLVVGNRFLARTKTPDRNFTGNRYATIPYPGYQPPISQQTERAVLRKLVQMMAQSPKAARYTVGWDAPGTKVGGVTPHVTAYKPSSGRFWDSYEMTGDTNLHLGGVRPADIQAVAQASGDFAQLKARVNRPKRRAGSLP